MGSTWDWVSVSAGVLPAFLRIAWDLSGFLALRGKGGSGPKEVENPPPVPDPAATLILCTHNDLEALKMTWPHWIGQQFPKGWQVEWLVVDDASSDGTKRWLEDRLKEFPRLSVVQHQKREPGKKGALAAGIQAARFDRLVLTDADCRPGPNWAFHMACALGSPLVPKGRDIALGISLPEGGPALLEFDALRVAFQYLGEAAAGRPYMGVGRNLAYRKSLWEKLGGFRAHHDLMGGDDDLFVQEAVREGYRVHPVSRPPKQCQTFTLPASSVLDGWRRKRRHLSTAPRYRWVDRLRLGLDALLDPMVIAAALLGVCGLMHTLGWIPVVALALAVAVRSITLSMFSREWGLRHFPAWKCAIFGPIRWMGLASATLMNAFTSSPKWTQRAPTSRS